MVWVFAVALLVIQVLAIRWVVSQLLDAVLRTQAELAEMQRVLLARLITHIENPPDVEMTMTMTLDEDSDDSEDLSAV